MTCMYCDTGQWCLWEGGWLSYTPASRALWGPYPDGMSLHKTWSVADFFIETYRAPTTVRVSQRCVLPNLWALRFGPAGSRSRGLLTLRPGSFLLRFIGPTAHTHIHAETTTIERRHTPAHHPGRQENGQQAGKQKKQTEQRAESGGGTRTR